MIVDGVKVDVIETEAVPGPLEGIADEPRLFVLAHRWGLTSAGPMTIRVGGTEASASIRVASSASLVAMKLHAAVDRTDDAKRAGDIYDIYRIVHDDRNDTLVQAFHSAPDDLVALVRSALRRFFDTEAERSIRWLRVHGGPDASTLAAQDLRSVGISLIDSLNGA